MARDWAMGICSSTPSVTLEGLDPQQTRGPGPACAQAVPSEPQARVEAKEELALHESSAPASGALIPARSHLARPSEARGRQLLPSHTDGAVENQLMLYADVLSVCTSLPSSACCELLARLERDLLALLATPPQLRRIYDGLEQPSTPASVRKLEAALAGLQDQGVEPLPELLQSQLERARAVRSAGLELSLCGYHRQRNLSNRPPRLAVWLARAGR